MLTGLRLTDPRYPPSRSRRECFMSASCSSGRTIWLASGSIKTGRKRAVEVWTEENRMKSPVLMNNDSRH
jgi:hypothetical protein